MTTSNIGSIFNCGGDFAKAKTFICGLECEIESIKGPAKKKISNFLSVPDGSLRNNGIEYTTAVPTSREEVVLDFQALHKALDLGNEPFSERTSTHVHVNVSNLTEKDARQMVLLYALFEEFFFAMVQPERRDNIHCVPLTETYLPSRYAYGMQAMMAHWHKYTALNLKRMQDLGTMEFRHMHGTNNAEELNQWLHVLENLWKLAQRIDINETTLSKKEEIVSWFEMLFFPAPKVMMLLPSLFNIIRNSLIDVKMSTIPV